MWPRAAAGPEIDDERSPPSPAAPLCYATNVKASATYETQLLQKAMGGHGNTAFLTGLLTDANTALREQGVRQAVSASGGKVGTA